ncbi:hypothetical protein THRCLA_07857 [Thraustotheca clavata]|uniref:ZZ-type domain-containing protein n=1 Tax=Thraustotheca clavata TaxID=74557 RepID=A0A1V9ZC20_9STRA|nr:hypothetical protein THRCLA_07857 [Thraustotheca clavata]
MEFTYEGGIVSASLADTNEYVGFKQFVCSSYGLSKCVTSYVDVDGDSVTIGNQADLDEALAYMTEEELPILSVKVVGTKAEYKSVDVTKPAKKFTVEEAVMTLIEMMQEWTFATNEQLTIDLKQGFFNILLDPSFIDCWNRIVFDNKNPFNEYANAILTAICKQDVVSANELLNRADDLGDLVNFLFQESPQTSKLLATALPSLIQHFANVAQETIVVEEVVEPATVEVVEEQNEEEEKAPAPSTVVHSHRICDGCGMYPLLGIRHQSEQDRNLDFCSACVVIPRFQSLAPFRAIETELVVHYNIECDGCGAAPVEGVRYKSAITEDYDLCMLCEASGKYGEHEPFIKITTPEKAAVLKKKNKTASVPAVHMNIQCDGCNKHPIVGARYKSSVIKEFDLCESCEASGAYNESHGPFLKITNIDQTPFALYVATEKMHRDGTEPKETPTEFTSRVHSSYGACSPPRCWRGSRRHPKSHRGPMPPFNYGIPPPPPMFAPPQSHRGHRRPPMDKPEPYLRSRFVEDITIPDGTVCAPGQTLTKKWRLQNNGNNAWPQGCEVQVVGGMGIVAQAPIPVPPLAPGEDFVLSIDVQAPLENGRFVCYFRVCSPSGSRFGHRFWVDLVVDDSIPRSFEENITTEEDKEETQSSSDEQDHVDEDVSSIPMATLVVQDDAPEVTIEPQLQTSEITQVTEVDAIDEEPQLVQSSEVNTAVTENDTYEFATQLEELMLMGFTDEELNRSLLNQHNGNLERLIEILLQ